MQLEMFIKLAKHLSLMCSGIFIMATLYCKSTSKGASEGIMEIDQHLIDDDRKLVGFISLKITMFV